MGNCVSEMDEDKGMSNIGNQAVGTGADGISDEALSAALMNDGLK
mgnify:CR=1 FL=1